MHPYCTIVGALWVWFAVSSGNSYKATVLAEAHRDRMQGQQFLYGDTIEVDYFANMDSCKTIQGFGRIQNTNHSIDSVDKIGAISVYNSRESYEVVCVYRSVEVRSRLSQDSAAALFLHTEDWKNDLVGYHCFAFVYAMKDPDFLGDAEEEVEFPARVRAFQRIGLRLW